MPYLDLQSFLLDLERAGQLRRVRVEVDPDLEVTEIVTRVVRQGGPALLFERVRGSPYPLAINVLGSAGRIELALGRQPGQIGRELIGLLERLNPPSLKTLFQSRRQLLGLLSARAARHRGRALSQEVVEPVPDLAPLPAITCWPEDGGRFITLPLVITHDPATGVRNVGIYRMHVFDQATTGMHWQLQKGGGFHYLKAERMGRPLEVAAVLGGDPALILASAMPLPEGFDEVAFSGILRGRPLPMVPARSIGVRVPASAEFVLEGVVPPAERRMEGPFGDHLGHYSGASPFPVFHLRAITRRRHPVYPAAVVGRPPQEDCAIGDAVQQITAPLVRLIHPEVRDMWAYFETGFHNLLVAAVEPRYTKEPVKTALGLLGNGQLALTKCVVLVEAGVDVRDLRAVLREVRDYFRPERDFLLLPRVPLDTLDFTSFEMHLGSKMVLDATRFGKPAPSPPTGALQGFDPRRRAPEVTAWSLWEGALLAVQAPAQARRTLERLVAAPELEGLPILAAVSPDVDLEDRTDLLWGLFTRFDPARDVLFPRMEMQGAAPVYRGVMGIDATHKPGYPAPLEMREDVRLMVDRRWGKYGL